MLKIRINFFILLVICYFINFNQTLKAEIKEDNIESSFINIFADESLYHILEQFVNKFVLQSGIIVNVRYIDKNFNWDDFLEKKFKDRVNVFIGLYNEQKIAKYFEIKENITMGLLPYELCYLNKDLKKILYFNELSIKENHLLNDLLKSIYDNSNENVIENTINNDNKIKSIAVLDPSYTYASQINLPLRFAQKIIYYQEFLKIAQDFETCKIDTAILPIYLCGILKQKNINFLSFSLIQQENISQEEDILKNLNYFLPYKLLVVNDIGVQMQLFLKFLNEQNFFNIFTR